MAFTDDFTGSDGDLLEDRTGWTKEVDGAYKCDIYSNGIAQRSDGSGSGRSLYVCDDQGSLSHVTQGELLAVNSNAELLAWAVDQDNYLCLYHAGTGAIGARLAKRVSGTRTDLITVSGTSGASQTWKMEVDDSAKTAEFFLDDVSQGSTDITSLSSDTSQGVIAQSAVGDVKLIDNFEASPLAGGTTHTASATLSGSATLTALPEHQQAASAVLSGTGTLAAIPTHEQAAQATLTGVSTLTATATLISAAAATALLAGQGTLSAVGTLEIAAATVLSGSSTLTGIGTHEQAASAIVSGAATIQATATVERGASSALSGTGTLTATATLISAGATASLLGQGTLTASASLVYGGSVVLTGSSSLVASPLVEFAGNAALSGVGTLVANASIVAPTNQTALLAGTSSLVARVSTHLGPLIATVSVSPSLVCDKCIEPSIIAKIEVNPNG